MSCVLAQGRKEEAGGVARVAADEVEGIVFDAIRKQGREPENIAGCSSATAESTYLICPSDQNRTSDTAAIVAQIDKITIGSRSIAIQLVEGSDRAQKVLIIPWTAQVFRCGREVIQPSGDLMTRVRPIRAEAGTKLLSAIARARRWLGEISSGIADGIDTIARREGMSVRSARMGLSLAFLAPDIIQAAVEGTLPRGLGVSRLTDLPVGWVDQRRAVGIAPGG